MKEIIRKILAEEVKLPDSSLSQEKRIEIIQNNYKQLEEMLPLIVKLLKVMFKDKLSRINVVNQKVYFATDDYTSDSFLINVVLENYPASTINKRDLFKTIDGFTGVDLGLYGVPMDIFFYDNEKDFVSAKGVADSLKISIHEVLKSFK